MDFAGMVMRAQLVNVRVGFRKPGDVFAGKNGGGSRPCQRWCSRSILPLACGEWGMQETIPIKFEGGAAIVGAWGCFLIHWARSTRCGR